MFRDEYWDIESLSHLFSLAHYKRKENEAIVYLLLDETAEFKINESFKRKVDVYVRVKNPNFKGKTIIKDLRTEEANLHLYKSFLGYLGRKVTDPLDESLPEFKPELRPVCSTDKDFDIKKHAMLFGYNSVEYDMTMLSCYFQEVFDFKASDNKETLNELIVKPNAKPSIMREYNDILFSPDYKKKMSKYATKAEGTNLKTFYDNLRLTGRFIDLSLVNETKRYQGLKRLFGYIGRQILEWGDFSSESEVAMTEENVLNLIAYNVSDVVNLKYLYDLPRYQNSMKQKYTLLQEYPETIYTKEDRVYLGEDENGKKLYEFKRDPRNVKFNRSYIDNGTARMAEVILCPYGQLKDDKVVSLMYPHPDMAKRLGVESKDILEDTKEWIESKFPDPNSKPRKEFERIYAYYDAIRGKNFNSGKVHGEHYNIDVESEYDPILNPYAPAKLEEILPESSVNTFYYDKYGKPTTCTITLKLGGTHGQEMEKKDNDEYKERLDAYNNETSLITEANKYRNKEGLLHLNPRMRRNLKPKPKFIKLTPKDNFQMHKEPKQIFTKKRNSADIVLNKQASFTSVANCINADFESYYPNMLRNLMAFFNSDFNYDRYGELFDKKHNIDQVLKGNKKTNKLTKEEIRDLTDARNIIKLLLNAPTGLADAEFYSNIRMNNRILTMRIIGQLFLFRIGQALSYEGGRVFSTNTDGLYTEMEEELHNKILAEESKNININIEPENMFIVSKDSNTRFVVEGKKLKVSGGDINGYYGPSTDELLTVASITHYTLVEYLKKIAQERGQDALYEPFDRNIAKQIMKDFIKHNDNVTTLKAFQIIVSASSARHPILNTYADDPTNTDTVTLLSKYSRLFFVDNIHYPKQHINNVNYKKISTTTLKKRRETIGDKPLYQDHPVAKEILKSYGFKERPSNEHEAVFEKVTDIEKHWNVYVNNNSLYELEEAEQNHLIESFNLDNYLEVVQNKYESNWRNHKYPSF